MAYLRRTLLTFLLYSLTYADEDYRLPSIYSPSNYYLNIVVTEGIFTNSTNQYNASVSITFTVSTNTSQIQLHSSYSYITLNSIDLSGVTITNYTVNNVTDIATLYLDSEISSNGTYALNISYTSTISSDDMYGFYKSSYNNSANESVVLLASQFEAAYARRAFPCFDEPSFKAKFDLNLTYPSSYTAISNMEANSTNTTSNYTTTIFNTTPVMSTYLLAFVISDFTCTNGTLNDTSLRQSVCSRNSTASTRDWAVEVTPFVIDTLNSYTAINYSVSMTKLDQVAIPDFAAGAMENWGLITYRETALLYDTNESSAAYKQYVATVIAHELAHQWFGNLVTTKWWSTIFLNEGFATFFEFYVPHQFLPDYELAHQFVTKVVQPVLLTDSYTTAQTLESNASTPSEISNKFGTISYDKGGSILKMVEHFLSTDIFQYGVRSYLLTHQYNNTEPTDLWTALDTIASNYTLTSTSLPTNLSTIMENWISKSGYPVINVTYNNGTITFTQNRFLMTGNDSESTWYVPISYTTSDNTSEVENTFPKVWMAPNDSSVSVEYNSSVSTWMLVNNKQTGYYRVNYDSVLLSNLSSALRQSNFSNIPEINRAQFIDDAFNLARASYMNYSTVFNSITFLQNDTSYHSWYAAIRGFDYLIRRVGLNTTLGAAIGDHLLELLENVKTSVPLSTLNTTSHVYTLNQNLVHLWACKLGYNDSITNILQMFEEYKNTSVRPNKDLRTVIYCNGLRYSSNISSDWEFLWNAYLDTELATEKAVLISALGCATDEDILNQYLLKSITDDSGIRSQDAVSVFTAVYTTNVDVAFEFFLNYYSTIVLKYNSMNAVGTLLKRIAEYFTTEEQLTKLKSFINSTVTDEDLLTSASEAVEIVEDNLNWMSLFRDDLETYYGVNENSTENETTTEDTTGGAGDNGSAFALIVSLAVFLSVLFNVM